MEWRHKAANNGIKVTIDALSIDIHCLMALNAIYESTAKIQTSQNIK